MEEPSDAQNAIVENSSHINGDVQSESAAKPSETAPMASSNLATIPSGNSIAATATQTSLDQLTAEENITVANGKSQEPSSRGRGRGGARGRGKSRNSLSSTKARKRKRTGQNSEDDETASSSDEVSTPTALITKSGRNVQRPAAYVPPATASPNAASNGVKTESGNSTARVFKKKRVWRRNAENAVCKSCLRGTSPASNMIVFCDGCNTPYHRWCHHPPIDQNVIDEPDKEWYCRACARERVVPVPEHELAQWVAVPNATYDQVSVMPLLS